MRLIEKTIENAIKSNLPLIIGIDGQAGSGKSTFSTALAEKYSIDVISMDDFFLPVEMKTVERLENPGNNFHHERFLKEVVPNIFSTKPWQYGAFNCQTKTLYTKQLQGHKVKIVEGVYSCHPLFESIYDIKISFHINQSTQKERILKRNGIEMWTKFETIWIPQEDSYFDKYRLFDTCHYLINGDNSFEQANLLKII
ncbi:MAG: hypothetical protein ABS942_04940 [Solibacillus sp.]